MPWLHLQLWLAVAAARLAHAGDEAAGREGGHAPDPRTHMGSCGIPIPEAFSCRSLPEWSGFLDHIRANAMRGFPGDLALFEKAQAILVKWQDKPYPPQDFWKYLCGGPQETWPLPDRFCLYGFVAALFIRSRHLMHSDDVEYRKSADMDFQYATTVLGKEGSVDLLDSSPWPLSILDIYININETDFVTYEHYTREHPVQPPAVPLESIYWQPPVRGEPPQRAVPASILMSVIGTHATLSLEPVDMLRRFASDVELRAVFFGLEPRWCQILGMCDQGTSALSQLFKQAEKDPYAFPWDAMVAQIAEIYDGDSSLQRTELLLCTEPLAGCLMLMQVAEARGKKLPLLGYLGVALLNSCPPEDVDTFWAKFRASEGSAVLAVNNLILSEQVYYQSGRRMPYVRAHGLYTGMSYVPLKFTEVLFWRAPLFMYSTAQCAVERILEGTQGYPITFRFMGESESIAYEEAAKYKAVVLLPWDHALMTFYELYSAGIPMLLPAAEWMYRFLYQRGQLSVGERMYQSVMPGHVLPYVEFADSEVYKENPGPPNPSVGMSSAKAARHVAEDMLARGLEATDLSTAKQYLKAALELMQDMRYFLAVAENRTDEDSYTSMGVVRRSKQPKAAATSETTTTTALSSSDRSEAPKEAKAAVQGQAAESPVKWHPYTPFQMSTRDSNDWTRMRKGGWWLRRGVRFDAMRYWYQFSDFARFPGLQYFAHLPELLCKVQSMDVQSASESMRRYNEKTLVHSVAFWTESLVHLVGSGSSAT